MKKKKKRHKIGNVKSHFLDSGAFSLWTIAATYHKENKCGRWDYYDTDEFWAYADAYVKFVKKYKIAIDYHANLDVIPNPELTWRNQQYLESKGLTPVPVVHYTTDLKWLHHYIEHGYQFIGLGGLVGSTMKKGCKDWIANCFDIVHDTPDRMPKVKIHGFGVTSWKLLLRFPWWSVDSAAWDKIASFGGICVPHRRKGKWDFSVQPYIMKVSFESPNIANVPDVCKGNFHYFGLTGKEQQIVKDWLDFIGIPLGSLDKEGKPEEQGVITFHVYRRVANLYFFDLMVKSLPEWPRPYTSKNRKSLL